MENPQDRFEHALRLEQERLVAAILRSADFQKLQALNEVARGYGLKPLTVSGTIADPPPSPNSARSMMTPHAPRHADAVADSNAWRLFGYGEKTKAVGDAAEEFLRQRGRRAAASEFLTAMAAARIEIGGKNPDQSMASFLSTLKNRFNNVKPHGYGLVEWGDGLGPAAESMRESLSLDYEAKASDENEPSTDNVGDGSETGASNP